MSDKAVSIRSLVRYAAEVLDAVEIEGSSFVITRLGRPVARLSPFGEGRPMGNRRRTSLLGAPVGVLEGTNSPSREDGDDSDEAVREVASGLDEIQQRALMWIASFDPNPCNGSVPPDTDVVLYCRALGQLLLKGLAKTHSGVGRLTAEGKAVVRFLAGSGAPVADVRDGQGAP